MFAVSGCVTSGPAPGGFTLTDAVPVTEPGGGRQSAPSNETAAASTGAAYVLLSTAGDDLAKYVNHRVEVRGMLGPPPPTPTAATSTLTAPAGSITVQEVKVVSASCS